jgi:pimeloyl-ACP methyl ester carboxylesterase
MKVTSKIRRGLWWSLALLVLLMVGAGYMAHRVEFRTSDIELKNLYQENSTSISIHRYKVKDRTVRFVEFGCDTLPVTILVHGAPSSLNFFNTLYSDTSLTNHMLLVGVDRPGYGYSGFGKSVTSVREQALFLQPLIDYYYRQGRKVVLAASSYGGSVVAKLAMDNPDAVSGILFISSSLAPGQEYTYPISYVIDSPWFSWLFPTILRVANDEKMHHRQALEDIQDGWERIRSRIILLHGKADGLIYFSNAEYARKHLTNAASLRLIPVDGLGHTLMFDRPELIKSSLLELIHSSRINNLAQSMQ